LLYRVALNFERAAIKIWPPGPSTIGKSWNERAANS
jgi:hypothetical protein